jgi:hypothetical protein
MSKEGQQSRRTFLAALPAVLVAISGGRGWAAGVGESQSAADAGQKKAHPEPRRGIDASHVTAAKDLGGDRKAIEAFDMVREIPQVVDGIRCTCGCESIDGYYSLLSCFEKDGMARDCAVCQGHARLIHRLHREGKTLAQIRAAVDAGH